MTTLAMTRGAVAQLLGSTSRGYGKESNAIDAMLREVRRDRSRAASSPQSAALSQLLRTAAECSRNGWDGYDGKAISNLTLRNARAFLEALPIWLATPTIVPESDGALAFEWQSSAGQIFSVSVGESSTLHFAGLLGGGAERHGVEPFAGVVPGEILGYIAQVVGVARAA